MLKLNVEENKEDLLYSNIMEETKELLNSLEKITEGDKVKNGESEMSEGNIVVEEIDAETIQFHSVMTEEHTEECGRTNIIIQ